MRMLHERLIWHTYGKVTLLVAGSLLDRAGSCNQQVRL